ncbi:MAG: hypothetical protein E6Q97_33450 [Desulfurellales bacterium]|jgi:phage virion morphogenesis protein|nr:MAG: hypothetical protein E6Q97_33450 [Desulfurellales bacterium]
MLKVNLSINSANLEAKLQRVEEVMSSGILLDTATAMLLNRIRTRFLAEQSPDGTPWIPSKAGLRRRAKGGTGTLFDTGRLFYSIQAAGEGPDIRYLGTDVPYAQYHQGPAAKVERPFLGLGPQDAELLQRFLQRRLDQLLS